MKGNVDKDFEPASSMRAVVFLHSLMCMENPRTFSSENKQQCEEEGDKLHGYVNEQLDNPEEVITVDDVMAVGNVPVLGKMLQFTFQYKIDSFMRNDQNDEYLVTLSKALHDEFDGKDRVAIVLHLFPPRTSFAISVAKIENTFYISYNVRSDTTIGANGLIECYNSIESLEQELKRTNYGLARFVVLKLTNIQEASSVEPIYRADSPTAMEQSGPDHQTSKPAKPSRRKAPSQISPPAASPQRRPLRSGKRKATDPTDAPKAAKVRKIASTLPVETPDVSLSYFEFCI